MSKFIVTTTINKPTIATLKYCEIAVKKNWKFVIIGDLKTPHDEYKALENDNVIYLSPEQQDSFCKELSDTIGWKTIQRRNVGFVYAYRNNATLVATVDDDNIPYENWGDNIYVDKDIEVDIYTNTKSNFFDPLSVTNCNDLWHRGYPIECLNTKNDIEYKGKFKRRVLVQSDLWDGDPDIDAICRLSKKPIVKFNNFEPFGSNQLSPFNSQNTFLSPKVLSVYAVLPYIGRMDDIWGSYILQYYYPNSVIYNKSTVYQERNIQDLIKNMENEIIGYRNTYRLLNDLSNFKSYLPEQTIKFWKIYKNQF
jgi:hypothetical protein